MTTFNEHDHPRAGTGQFTEKPLAGPATATLEWESEESLRPELPDSAAGKRAGHFARQAAGQLEPLLETGNPADREVASLAIHELDRQIDALSARIDQADFAHLVFEDERFAGVQEVVVEFYRDEDGPCIYVEDGKYADGMKLSATDSVAISDIVFENGIFTRQCATRDDGQIVVTRGTGS